MAAGLESVDYAIIAGSLVVVFAVAIWSSIYRNAGGAESYFLAGRSMPWFICAASIFASNVGIEHFVGMPGAGASGGLAVSLYEWTAAYQILMLGWLFAPIYLRCKLTTIPEFLELRYNKYCRFLYVVITMVAYVTSKLGASLYAGALFLDIVAGLTLWQAIPVILVATCIYTISGGLTAVMFTDTVQMIIFVLGGLAGAIKCLQLIGGYQNVVSILRESNLDFMTHVIHSPEDRDYPWPGMFLGLPIASTWYWCLDQEMAQRVLSAKNLDHAQIGSAAAGFMKIIPVLLTVVPGMVARALFEKCKAVGDFSEWCEDPAFALDEGNNADKVYALIIVREFHSGLKGVMMATFLAALMSSLSSVYNSASTIFTYDVYQRMKYPEGDGPAKELINVGRVTVVVLTLLTFAWIPVIEKSQKGLFMVLQNATMHLAGPIVAIFLLAIFWKRANGPGALSGFLTGSAVGIVHLIVSVVFEDKCNEYVSKSSAGIKQVYTASNWIMCMNYLYVSIFLCAFSMLVTVVVSLMTPPPSESQLKGRMFEDWGFWTRICTCCKSSSADASSDKPGTEDDEHAQLLDPELPTGIPQSFNLGHCRVVANLSGIGVLVAITALIIAFR